LAPLPPKLLPFDPPDTFSGVARDTEPDEAVPLLALLPRLSSDDVPDDFVAVDEPNEELDELDEPARLNDFADGDTLVPDELDDGALSVDTELDDDPPPRRPPSPPEELRELLEPPPRADDNPPTALLTVLPTGPAALLTELNALPTALLSDDDAEVEDALFEPNAPVRLLNADPLELLPPPPSNPPTALPSVEPEFELDPAVSELAGCEPEGCDPLPFSVVPKSDTTDPRPLPAIPPPNEPTALPRPPTRPPRPDAGADPG
jgi:hypothetical protein